MNDAFAQVIGPVVQHVIDLQGRLSQGEDPPLEEVRGELLALIDEAEQRAAVARDLAGDFALAKHALVYWIDEVLINSRWPHAPGWRDAILEWDYYGERLGGEKFFEKAREAEALRSTDPLETFLTCVALGFQGRMGFNRSELKQWADRAFARVAGSSDHPERFLPEEKAEDREPMTPLPGTSALLAVSVLVSATALVTLAAFILTVHLAS